ncbi:PAS domain S-box-containing protein [Parvularcula dongshanensis]|uniref:PAS domain S-box-containing protein n=1 Tax=Parvularcula dongshanensis TaxID=1173995 RepID=A0A840I2D3_9PROT|nr:PAS domain S-box-containing protein [Parvularcula dongshanensis]
MTDYAIYTLDKDGRVASWNPGAERAKGYTADDITGRHFSCFYPSESQAAGDPAQALEMALRTGTFEAEGWRVRKDGTRFWVMVVIDPVYDGDGELMGFAKITKDCTERNETAREAQETADGFRLLVEGVTDYAIYMLDPQGHGQNWNAGAERAKGYKASEIVGHHFSRFSARRTARQACRTKPFPRRVRRASSRRKAGATEKTARAFGRAWSSIRSITRVR